MKTKFIAFVLCSLSLFSTSCDNETIRASDEVSRKTFVITDFDGLKVSDTFKAYVRFSETDENIVVEANDNLHDRIIVKKEGNDLVAELERNTNLKGNVTLNIYITARSLDSFEASGASGIYLEDALINADATIHVSGASEFMGELSANQAAIEASGASDVNLYGSAGKLLATLEGSSSLADYDFTAGELNLKLSGASDARLSVTDQLNVDASGASTLLYIGNPQMGTIKLSGASTITKME